MPAIHDKRVVTEVPDDTEVVADEHERQPAFLAQFDKQVEHLGLHADIECGDSLVADEKLGTGGQCPCNHDALALPPREGIRTPRQCVRFEAHGLDQVDGFIVG